MSVSDDLMWRYYELLTDLTMPQIEQLKNAASNGEKNPRDLKVDLAKRIVTDFHSQADADAAEEDFVRRFRHKETPDEIEERTIPSQQPSGWDLSSLLVAVGLAESKAEARRLIQQGGVSVDAERQTSANASRVWEPGSTATLKVGKRRFLRVRFE